MEREAQIAENLNKQLKFRAMPRQIYVIWVLKLTILHKEKMLLGTKHKQLLNQK
jgi:hypothetical protein